METMGIERFMSIINGSDAILMNIDDYNIKINLIDPSYIITDEDMELFKSRVETWKNSYEKYGMEPFFMDTGNQADFIVAGTIQYGQIEK